jgi:membrane protease YdiL (CAAX protease family)
MIRLRDIAVVFIFSIIIRAFIGIWGSYWFTQISPYFIDLFAQAIMYLTMLLSYFVLLKEPFSLSISYSFFSMKNIGIFFILIPSVLVVLTIGEFALESLIISQYNPKLAYQSLPFHSEYKKVYPFFSMNVLIYIFVIVFLAPLAEEFVFRYLLLSRLSRKYGFWIGAIIASLLFTSLHFAQYLYISTFIFSIILSILYVIKRNWLICFVVHASNNLITFIYEYYFGYSFTKKIEVISELSSWSIELLLLTITLFFIVNRIYRLRHQINNSVADYNISIISKT